MATVDAASLHLAQFCARVQASMRPAWVTFPDLHFDETNDPHCSFDGERVAWRWRMRGTMTGPIEPPGFAPTGRTIEVEGVRPVDDARRAHRPARAYDMSEVARQLGIAPAPGGVGEKAVAALQPLQARLIRRRSA
jgi:SnoaL-like polyketide cyclase